MIISHFSWINVRSYNHDRIELAKVEWKWFKVYLSQSISFQIIICWISAISFFQVGRILYLFGMNEFLMANFYFTISNIAHCNSMFFFSANFILLTFNKENEFSYYITFFTVKLQHFNVGYNSIATMNLFAFYTTGETFYFFTFFTRSIKRKLSKKFPSN